MPFDTTPRLLLQRTKATTVVLGWCVPLLITLVVAVLMLSWRHELPDPIAGHWGASDIPDGVIPFWGHFAAAMGFLVLTPVVTTGVAWWQLRRGVWGVGHRFLVASAVGFDVLMGFIFTMTVYVQRGLEDAALAPGVSQWVIAGTVLGATGGAITFFLQPRFTVTNEEPIPATEDVWAATVSAPRLLTVIFMVITLLLWGLALVVAVQESPWPAIVVGLSGTLVALAYGVFARIEVTASSRGLRVRSAFGWPTIRIPIDEIESAEACRVDPFAEFGGWGFRFGPDGRRGIVVQSGPAIQVRRRGKQPFVVTVDGAESGAAVLRRFL